MGRCFAVANGLAKSVFVDCGSPRGYNSLLRCGSGRFGLLLSRTAPIRLFFCFRMEVLCSMSPWFAPTPERIRAVTQEIADGSEPKISYYLLLVTAAMIACFGLVTNSTAVIIGAMLVSPLMTPIFGIALAMLRGDGSLLFHGLRAEFGGVALAVGAAFLFGLSPVAGVATPEMLSRTHPQLLDLLVAVFAGFAGAYALLDERVSPALPGVAIATAIVPPLSTCGLCLAMGAYGAPLGPLSCFSPTLLPSCSCP
jgi:uncharacterized hydrophobic protein (TIGR00271 family)